MQKSSFLLRIDPARIDEYLQWHRAVWPEMLEALHESGYRNYSLFLDDSGLLVGYFEAEDPDAAIAAMQKTDVNARWSALLDELFVDVDEARPVGTIATLRLAFDLDAQLAAQTEARA